jgi:hypothetical protein
MCGCYNTLHIWLALPLGFWLVGSLLPPAAVQEHSLHSCVLADTKCSFKKNLLCKQLQLASCRSMQALNDLTCVTVRQEQYTVLCLAAACMQALLLMSSPRVIKDVAHMSHVKPFIKRRSSCARSTGIKIKYQMLGASGVHLVIVWVDG